MKMKMNKNSEHSICITATPRAAHVLHSDQCKIPNTLSHPLFNISLSSNIQKEFIILHSADLRVISNFSV